MRWRGIVATLTCGALLIAGSARAQTFGGARPNPWATPSAPPGPMRREAPPLDQNGANTVASELKQRNTPARQVASDLKQEGATPSITAHALKAA
ncbi:MAG TPA: hypothetical protein VJR89_17325, partial [Polyangiales bacterium]|nr:hypothetical protein [Polyangiales bacterium]